MKKLKRRKDRWNKMFIIGIFLLTISNLFAQDTPVENALVNRFITLQDLISNPSKEVEAYAGFRAFLSTKEIGEEIIQKPDAEAPLISEDYENLRLAALRYLSNYIREFMQFKNPRLVSEVNAETTEADSFNKDLPSRLFNTSPKNLIPLLYRYAALEDGYLILEKAARLYLEMGKLRLAAELLSTAIEILPEYNRDVNGETKAYKTPITRIWNRLANIYILRKDKHALYSLGKRAEKKKRKIPLLYEDLKIDDWAEAFNKMPEEKDNSLDHLGLEFLAKKAELIYQNYLSETPPKEFDLELLQMVLPPSSFTAATELAKTNESVFYKDENVSIVDLLKEKNLFKIKQGLVLAYVEGTKKYFPHIMNLLHLSYSDRDRSIPAFAFHMSNEVKVTEEDLPDLIRWAESLSLTFEECDKVQVILHLLDKLDKKAVPALPVIKKFLQHSMHWIRSKALFSVIVLSIYAKESCIEELVQLMQDKEIADYAIALASRIPLNAQDFSPLKRALIKIDKNKELRFSEYLKAKAKIIELIGKLEIKDNEVFEHLLPLAQNNDDNTITYAALNALPKIISRERYLPEVLYRAAFISREEGLEFQEEAIIEKYQITEKDIPLIRKVLHAKSISSDDEDHSKWVANKSKQMALKLLAQFGEKSLVAYNDIKKIVWLSERYVQAEAITVLIKLMPFTQDKAIAELLVALDLEPYYKEVREDIDSVLSQLQITPADMPALLNVLLVSGGGSNFYIAGSRAKTAAWEMIKKLGDPYFQEALTLVNTQLKSRDPVFRKEAETTLEILKKM